MTNPRDAQTAPELHCPFCGHAPYTVEESAESFGKRTGHNYAIACNYCEASAPGAATMRDAWANWNERADTPAAQVTVAEAMRMSCAHAVNATASPIVGTPYSAGGRAFSDAIRAIDVDEVLARLSPATDAVARLVEAARAGLNYLENTEGEFGITLGSATGLRTALAAMEASHDPR